MSTSTEPKAPLFDLTLSDEQRMARESVSRFAENEMRPLAREVDSRDDIPAAFFESVHALGITAAPVPEALGGAGLPRSPVSNALIAEDLGKGDMTLALAALAPAGVVNALLDLGSEAQQARYLPGFASGRFLAASTALMEPRARFDAQELRTAAVKRGGGYVLNGVKTMVPLGPSARTFLVMAQLEGAGPRGFLVERDLPGVGVEPERYMGLRGLGLSRLTLADVKLDASALLGEGARSFDYQRFVDLSRIGAAAVSVGACAELLRYVVEYGNERVAFGEPITHRQSVAFMIADIGIELDGLRLMVYRAAARAEQGLDFHREAYLVQVQCASRTMEIGTNGVQLLGGHGFVQEHPAELWYRQLRAAAILEGYATI